jgi:glyoxylase-like metal-dependent hydrolase (beta-lactamase superfamily II)
MATLRFVGHQPGVAQHLEVLGYRWAAEREPLAEFPGGQWLLGQNLQQLPPDRVRQREKDAIGTSHDRHYMSNISDTSTISDICGHGPSCAGAATLLSVHLAWEPLTPTVHRCRLPFCDVTIGLVRGRTGALLVDTGTTLAEAAAVDSDVRRLAGRPVSHIVLTHKHFDHVLGSSAFADADIYCAPEVVAYLCSGTDRMREDALSHGADAAEIDRAIAALRPPRRGIYDAAIDLGDRTVTIAHPGRGHTTSDLVVVAPGPDDDPVVVFTGDLVEESADPAIDADSDLAAWPATLDRLLAAGGPKAIYVPGHGRVVDAEFVRRQRDWLTRLAGADPG